MADTFGIVTRILPQHRHSPHWMMNCLSRAQANPELDDFLFLPPALPGVHQAAPSESVLFLG